jgi:hypothetical protein
LKVYLYDIDLKALLLAVLKNYWIDSLIPIFAIFHAYVGVIFDCLRQKFRLFTLSRTTKAWPDDMNGFSISLSMLVSNILSLSYTAVCLKSPFVQRSPKQHLVKHPGVP